MDNILVHKENTTETVGRVWCKKRVAHIYKLLQNKHNIEADVHTSGTTRCELFLNNDGSPIDTIITFIDRELQHIFDPLQDIPRNHTDSYQKNIINS